MAKWSWYFAINCIIWFESAVGHILKLMIKREKVLKTSRLLSGQATLRTVVGAVWLVQSGRHSSSIGKGVTPWADACNSTAWQMWATVGWADSLRLHACIRTREAWEPLWVIRIGQTAGRAWHWKTRQREGPVWWISPDLVLCRQESRKCERVPSGDWLDFEDDKQLLLQ